MASRKSGRSSPNLFSRKENTMDSITHDFSDNDHVVAVVIAFIAKRRHERELAEARDIWANAMIAARDAGVTIADMSRATGVASPSIIGVINTALAKRLV